MNLRLLFSVTTAALVLAACGQQASQPASKAPSAPASSGATTPATPSAAQPAEPASAEPKSEEKKSQ